jgi:phosphopantetheine adenylyltransferase
MKKLVESLVNAVLEADEKVIGIYGGGFKPPTAGHYEVIENILKTNPQLDKLYIAVGQKERDGITQADSLLVFDVYKKYFPFKVEFVPVKSVYNYIKDFVEENPDKTVIAFRGAREGQEEDLVDNETFKMFLDRYAPDVEYKQVKTLITGVSGTKARQALKSGNKEKFFKYLPTSLSNLDRDKIYDILTATVEENAKKAAINAYSRELALGLEEQQGKTGYRAGSINPKLPQERLKDRGFAINRSTTGLLGTGFYFYGDKDQAVTSTKDDGRDKYTEIDLSQYKLFTPSNPEKFYNVIKNLTLLLTDLIFDEKVNFEDENVTKQLDLYSSYLSKELGLSDLEIELAAQSFIDDVSQSKDGVLLSNRILSDYDGVDLTGTSLDNFAVGSLIFDGKLKPGSYTSTKIQDLEEVGEASQKPYKWTKSESSRFPGTIDYSFITDKDTEYRAYFVPTSPGFYEFGFSAEDGDLSATINKGELFRVMSTIVDIMKDFVTTTPWNRIEFEGSKDFERVEKGVEDKRRDKLYRAYLKKNLSNFPNIDVFVQGGVTYLYNEDENSLTEVGEATQEPYKWTVKRSYWEPTLMQITYNFTTDKGIKYEALFYENADYRFDFLFYPEDGHATDIVNKGELFKVMSTIVDIMKDFIKKEKWSVIEYSSVKQHKGDERREKLYAAYLKKNLPDGIEVDETGGGDIMLTNLNLKEADPKKGTGKKPKGSGRRLYTDENPKDTVSIKFSTRQDIVDTLNKKSFKAKSHARQSQIINLIHQRVRAAYGRAKDPAVKKRLKSGLDYITKRKEASKKKTQRLKKQKVNENYQSMNFEDLLLSLSDFLKQKLELKSLPNLEYIDDDVENAENILGNTAYYNPNTSTIALYTKGRHPKDILRSYAHEMIHHKQNEDGKFDGSINTFNINQDDYLKQIEEEAYLNGNILFRSWENTIEK